MPTEKNAAFLPMQYRFKLDRQRVKAGGRTIHFEIRKLINSIWNKDEMREEWKELIILRIYKKDNKTDYINYRGISVLPTTYNILSNLLLSRLTPYAEEIIGHCHCGFQSNRSTTDHLIIYSAFVKYLRKNMNTMKQCISCL